MYSAIKIKLNSPFNASTEHIICDLSFASWIMSIVIIWLKFNNIQYNNKADFKNSYDFFTTIREKFHIVHELLDRQVNLSAIKEAWLTIQISFHFNTYKQLSYRLAKC